MSYQSSESQLEGSRPPFVGGSASPFIDEGDGFTGERERVSLLLRLVAHAGGYKTVVGARNTVHVAVECQMHGEVVLPSSRRIDVGTCKDCLMPRGM